MIIIKKKKKIPKKQYLTSALPALYLMNHQPLFIKEVASLIGRSNLATLRKSPVGKGSVRVGSVDWHGPLDGFRSGSL